MSRLVAGRQTRRRGRAAPSPVAPWPEPQPVPRGRPPVPPFEDALLPEAIRPWVADVAARVQCPADFVAVGVIVSAAAVIGRKVAIRPKRQDDWTVVPNLWGLAVGPPGVMKSPALAEALRPLSRLVSDAHAQYEEQMLAHHFHLAEARARRHDLTRRLRDAFANDEPTADLRQHFEAAPAYRPPVAKRYLVNDATVEKLGELLNHNPNGLLLFRDELSGFLHTMDRPGHENDRAFYCEAWNGTGAYTYDRIGRGTLHIRAACVSVLGGIQPGPLERYLREVFGGRGDDGLIQRFQLVVWPDVTGRWRNVDRWPDAAARGRAIEVFQRLNRLEAATVEAEELTPEEVPFLRFAPAAQELFDGWRADLEQRLRAEDEHPVLLSHLAKYRSLMPSLALILHLIDGVDGGVGGAVSGAAAERAAAWCQYLEAHARRLYATVTDRVRVAAALLASRMARGRLASPYRPRGLPQRLGRAHGASRRGGGARVPAGTRLDPATGGRGRQRGSARGAVPHQSPRWLSLRKPLRFCRFWRSVSAASWVVSAADGSGLKFRQWTREIVVISDVYPITMRSTGVSSHERPMITEK